MNKKLIDQFKQLAAAEELPRLLKANATLNLEFPVFSNRHFWESHESSGWQLQINTVSGWWRILNAEGIRVARGTTEEQLEALLGNRPTSTITNYLDKGYRFVKTPAKGTAKHTVVLIHGWSARARSMQSLADRLAQRGFDAYSYDYPTSKRSLKRHSQIFLSKFRKLLDQLPADAKVHILTHSMGGLLLRGAMASMTEEECRRICAIVMLGPPNRGSLLAYLGTIPLFRSFNVSLKDMTPDETSFVSTIPDPAWLPPVGIIAGRHDTEVQMEDTRLPDSLPHKHVVVQCSHLELLKPSKVLPHILKFYSKLSFRDNNPELSDNKNT